MNLQQRNTALPMIGLGVPNMAAASLFTLARARTRNAIRTGSGRRPTSVARSRAIIKRW
jgi:hypothetical protein